MVPVEYTLAGDLTKNVQSACEVLKNEQYCNLYRYIDTKNLMTVEAEKPSRRGQKVHLFNDSRVLEQLDYKAMVLLSPEKVGLINFFYTNCIFIYQTFIEIMDVWE